MDLHAHLEVIGLFLLRAAIFLTSLAFVVVGFIVASPQIRIILQLMEKQSIKRRRRRNHRRRERDRKFRESLKQGGELGKP